jgi:hypothetical protein
MYGSLMPGYWRNQVPQRFQITLQWPVILWEDTQSAITSYKFICLGAVSEALEGMKARRRHHFLASLRKSGYLQTSASHGNLDRGSFLECLKHGLTGSSVPKVLSATAPAELSWQPSSRLPSRISPTVGRFFSTARRCSSERSLWSLSGRA